MLELAQMKETMDTMEQERAEMVAEVEAQIEKALASMAVDMDESDYVSSRPNSRLSSTSKYSTKSRRKSDATNKTQPSRSNTMETTSVDSSTDREDLGLAPADESLEDAEVVEDDNEDVTIVAPSKKKRFSASELEMFQDSMNAVDEGISLKSDKIAQKVLEIEQKVRPPHDFQ